MSSATAAIASGSPEAGEWTVDELARRVDLPVRTIREYQTVGLLHPPRRAGRIGLYGPSHLHRLQLIARLQARGYSLAGIRDLLSAWRHGDTINDVLGLEPDQLVHVDESGTPATLTQLAELLPALVPPRLDELVATGVVEACGSDRYCVPSPSLLQLTADPDPDPVSVDIVERYFDDLGRRRYAEIARAIDTQFANSPAETKTTTERAFMQSFAQQVGDTGTILMAIVAVVFFVILLIAGNTMAVGGPGRSSAGIDSGVVEVFTRSGSVWTSRGFLTPSAAQAGELNKRGADMSERISKFNEEVRRLNEEEKEILEGAK